MPLQKPFRGLLSYLGELSGGQISFEPSQLMQLVVDAQDFIEPPETLTASAQVVGAAETNVTLFTVPDKEVWRLLLFSAYGGPGGAWVNSRWALEYFNSESGFGYPLTEPFGQTADLYPMVAKFSRPGLWVRAGDLLGGTLLSGGGAGNGNLFGQAVIQRLKF